MSAPHEAPACLIIGMPGSGKTTVARELARRDRLAFDADTVPGLGAWYDEDMVEQPYQSNPHWRDTHEFLWNIRLLENLILGRPHDKPFYLAGISQNALAALPLFNRVVSLETDAETLFVRLHLSDRDTPYPFEVGVEELPDLEARTERYRQNSHKLGLIAIDAWQPIEKVANDIIEAVETEN